MSYRLFCFGISASLLVCGSLHARDKQQRLHLTNFKILWGETELEAQSHLDLGVEETDASGVRVCKILNPAAPKVSEKKWIPLDFYTSVAQEEQAKHAATIGQADLFFKGDDLNRNGVGDSYKFTRELAPSLRESLAFLDKVTQDDKVQVLVTFRRGKLKFDGLMEARAIEVKDGCDAALVFCTKSNAATKAADDKLKCDADGWTHRILTIRAVADEKGYAADKAASLFSFTAMKETEKNDVFSLIATVVGTDEDPKTTEPTEIILATK